MDFRSFNDVLRLERTGRDTFSTVGVHARPDDQMRLFGGQVAAQSLRAAANTVDAPHHPHAVHAQFLDGGRRDLPIEYRVERVRDGRSFTRRHVEAHQGGRMIFELDASFHADEEGPDLATPVAPDFPHPEDAAEGMYRDGKPDQRTPWGDEFELRQVVRSDTPGPMEPAVRFWARSRDTVPGDRAGTACMLLYVSDIHSGAAGVVATGTRFRDLIGGVVSLDHAMWFHRPMPDPQEWFSMDVRTVSVGESRSLFFATIHALSGAHVASYTQEVLFRVRRHGG
ncbi:MAG: acyl-CoA thioesterase [Acidimicrobiia bacterium]